MTNFLFFDPSATYIYNGTTPQITGDGLPDNLSGTLTINNSSGVALSQPTKIATGGSLALTNGKLQLGNNSLTMAGGTITGGNATSYVQTTGTGHLRRLLPINAATIFPVGNTAYNPITLTSSNGDTIGIQVVDGAVPNVADNLKTVNRRWMVTKAGAGPATIGVTAQYNNGEAGAGFTTSPVFIGLYHNNWTQQTATHAGSNPFTVTTNSPLSATIPATAGAAYFAIGSAGAFSSAPVVTTTAMPSLITATGATLGGTLVTAGVPAATETGVVFSATADNALPAVNGSGVTRLASGTIVEGPFSVPAVLLQPNTQYSFRAYATADGNTFVYGGTAAATFYTLANVPAAPTVNGATAVTLNVAVNAASNPPATAFAIFETTTNRWVQADGSLGNTEAWLTAAAWGTKTVTGLSSSTTYTFAVKARNEANAETVLGPSASETTLGCTAPTGLAVSTITNTGATIAWTSTGVFDYEYIVSTSSTPPAGGTAITGTTEFVSGLASATFYYLHVRAKCGANFSPWATSDPFRTADAPMGLITWVPAAQMNFGTSPFPPTSADNRLTITGLTRGSGVSTATTGPNSTTAAANAWGGYGWQAAPNQDIRFTVAANNGYQLSFSALQLSYRISGSGPPSAALNYAIGNGPFANIATLNFSSNTAGNSVAPINLAAITALQYLAAGTVVTFQLLPAPASDNKGTFYIYNEGLVVNGSVSAALAAPVANPVTTIYPTCFTATWNPVPSATNYYLDVLQDGSSLDTASTTIAGWSFKTNLAANSGIAANLGQLLTTSGGTNTPTVSSETAAAQDWRTGNGTKSWTVTLSTTNYYNLKLSSKQRSSNTGPRDFKVQYRIGAGAWTDLTAVPLLADNYTAGVLNNISLPAACDNQASVSLRWVMTSDLSVAGGAISSSGASNIDDIKITGNLGLSTTYVPGYSNLRVGNNTSYSVTGLSPATKYYFVVRAEAASISSASSNQITTTTTSIANADYRSRATGNWNSAATWEYESGCNNTWTVATVPPASTNNVTIRSGHTVTLDVNPTIGAGKIITVANDGSLQTGAFAITGAGGFSLSPGGKLSIGAANGITASGSSGAVQVTGTRSFDPAAHYTYNGAASQATGNGLPAAITGSLTIANGGAAGNNTVTLTTNNTTVKWLALDNGLFAAGTSQQLNIDGNGTVTGNGGQWATTAAGGTLNFAGPGTINGSTTLNLLNVNITTGTLALATVPVIRGTLTINGGNLNAAPVYAAGSVLQYNTNYGRFVEWSAVGLGTVGTTPGYPDHVVVNAGTLDVYNNASNTARALNGNLTISSGAAINFNGMNADFTVGGNLTVAGTLNMNSMSKALIVKGNLGYTGTLNLSFAMGGDLYVGGDYTNNGTGNNFIANNRAVFFNGGIAQTISGTNATGGFDFPYLFINNTSGGVSLGKPITVSGGLTLTSGILTTSPAAGLTISATAANAINGGNAGSFINGPVLWRLPSNLAGTSTYAFPVGKGDTYLPLSLNNPTTGGTGPLVQVEAFNTASGGTPNNTTVSSVSNTEHWNITVASGNLTGTSLSLGRQTALGGLNAVGQSGNGQANGTYHSLGGTVSATSVTNSANTNSTGFFALVSLVPPPGISDFTSNNPSSTKQGYTGSIVTITGSHFNNASAVTINGIAATSYTVNSNTQITATVGAGLPLTGQITITTPAGQVTSGQTFTYLGYITAATGDWNTGATWLGGNVPPVNSVATIAHAITVNAAVANTPATVTVAAGGIITFGNAGNLPVNNSFTNNGTVVMTDGGKITMNANSSFTNGGTFTYGTGTVVVNGGLASTVTINGSFNLYNVEANGGVKFTNNAAINGTLLMNQNSYVNVDAPVYRTNSVLKYNTGGLFGRTSEWGTLAGAGYPWHVQLSGNTTLNATGNGGSNITIPLALAGDLTIDPGSRFYMQYNSQSMDSSLRIRGNLVLNGELAGSQKIGADVYIGGNWTNTGSYFPDNRAVFFNGISKQTITRSGGETFDYLIINKTADSVVLANNITVNKILTFTKGNIATGSNNVIIPANAAIGGAGSGTGWVQGNLQKWVADGSGVTASFEIGRADAYRPVSLTFNTVSTAGWLTGFVTAGNGTHPQLPLSGLDAAKTVKRWWSFSQSGLSFTHYTGNFTFSSADVAGNTSAYQLRLFSGGTWTAPATGTRNPLSTEGSNFTGIGEISIGEISGPPVIATEPTNQNNCGGNTSFSIATTSTPAPSIQWQVSTDGGITFSNLTNNSTYNGATTTTLTITTPTTVLNNYRYRAYITNINGSDTSVAARLLVGNNWVGTTDTDWFKPGNWTCGVPTIATDAIVIGGLTNYPVVNSATAGIQNLAMNAGSTLTVNSTLQIAGAIANSGTFTASSGTIEYKGSSLQTVAAGTFNGAINTLVINNTAGVTFNSNQSVSTKLSLAAGTLSVSGGNTLTVQDNGLVEQYAGTVAAPPAYGNGVGVDVSYLGSADLSATTLLLPSAGKVRHFTVAMANGARTVSTTVGQAITINGNLSITTGNLDLRGVLSVAGHWMRQATNTGFAANGNAVTFNGTAAQTVSSGTIETFAGFTLDNAAGLSLATTTDLFINGTLTFSSGKFTTNQGHVIISSSGSVAGAADGSGWVVGNLRKWIDASNPVRTFEIGGTDFYRPVAVTFTNVSTAGYIGATVTTANGPHPQLSASGIDGGKSVRRWWTISNSGVSFTNYAATFNFKPADVQGQPSDYVVRAYNGTSWLAANTTAKLPLSTTATGLNTVGDFAIGEILTPPQITQEPINYDACGNTATFVIQAAGTPPPAIQWQVSADGGATFTNLTNTGIYSGVTTATLSLNALTTAYNNYRYRAYITNINGSDTSLSARLLVGNNWVGTTDTDWFKGGNWTCGVPTTATDAIVIGGLTNYPVVGTGTAGIRNLTMQGGSTLTVTGILQITGAITASGMVNAANGTIEYSGVSAQAVTAGTFNGAIKNLVINNSAGVTFNTSQTVTTKFTLSAGVLGMAGGAFLTIADGALVEQVEGSVAAPPAYGNGVGVDVSYLGANDLASTPLLTPTAGKLRHLTLHLSNNTKTVSTTVGQGITVTGNLGISAGTLNLNGVLSLGGNWTRTPVSAGFTHNNNAVMFNGTSAQTISSASTENFGNLTLNNAAGLTLSTTTDLVIGGTLTFAAGKLTAGNGTVTIGSGASVFGAGDGTGWVIGDLRKWIPGGSNVHRMFEVGGPDFYRPVELGFSNVTTAGFVSASVTAADGDHPQLANAGLDPAKTLRRWWTLTNNGAVFGNYSATFFFKAGDVRGNPTAYTIRRYRSNAWSGTNTITAGSLFTMATGITTDGDFAIGEINLPPAITQHPVSPTSCTGAATFTVQASGTPAPAFQWQVSTNAGGSFSNIADNTIYAGAATATLTVNGNISMNGYQYRARVFNINDTLYSNPATLYAGNYWLGGTDDWFTGANWSCAVPGTTTDAIIPAGKPFDPVVNNAIASVKSLTLDAGAVLRINSRLRIAGAVSQAGSITATDGTIEFNGTAAQNLSTLVFTGPIANLVMNNAAGVQLAAPVSLRDTLFLQAGTLTMTAAGTLSVADNGSVEHVSGAVLPAITYGNATGVDVAYRGNTTQSGTPLLLPASGKVRNLAIALANPGATVTTSAASVSLAGNLAITGGNLALGGSFTLAGNWNRSATSTGFSAGTQTVTFNGTTAQTLRRPGGESFYALSLNNPAGLRLDSATKLSIGNSLAFTSGVIVTDTNRVVLSAGAVLSGAAAATGWVAGLLQKAVGTGAQTVHFEVGDAAAYRPLQVAFTSVQAAGNLLASLTQQDGEHPDLPGSYINPAKNVNRYFTLVPGGGFTMAPSSTANISLRYLDADKDPGTSQGNFVVRRYSNTGWSPFNSVNNSISNTTTVLVGGLAGFNEFVVGECLTADASDLTVAVADTCRNMPATVVLRSTSLAAATYNVTWQLSGSNSTGLQSTNVTFSGSPATGSFSTAPLTTAGSTTITISAIQLASTLQCSPVLSSGNSLSFTVRTAATSPTSITATASSICTGGSTKLTVNGGSLGTDGSVWTWYEGAGCGGISIGTGPSIQVSPAVNTTYSVRAEGTCGNTACVNLLITVGGSNLWTGTKNTTWADSLNWQCGFPPLPQHAVVVPASPAGNRFPELSSDVAVASLTWASPATLTLNGQSLTLGALSGNGSFSGSKTASLVLNGGTAPLSFSQAADTVSNALDSLVITGGSFSLASRLAIYNLLDLAGGSLNLDGKSLVLKSNFSGTAKLAELKGALSGETNVTVERYIPKLNGRKWRLVTAPVSGPSLNTSWQEGMTKANGVHQLTGSSAPATPVPGYGTIITGHGQGSAANANGNGFDYWDLIRMAASSVRRYAGAPNPADAWWEWFNNTTTPGAFNGSQAYLLFVRGDRSVYLPVEQHGVGATTLRATGTLRKGPQSFTVYGSAVQSHTMIGNPYPAPLDFGKLYAANPGLVKRYFWLLNSGLSGQYGAWQLVYGFPDGTWQALPTPLTTPNQAMGNTTDAIIHSGSGFLVEPEKPTTEPAGLQVREEHKAVLEPTVSPFRVAGAGDKLARLYINLTEGTPTGYNLLDGAVALWDQRSHGKTEEVGKAVNTGENLSIFKANRDLILTAGATPKAGDTLRLRLWNTASRTYHLQLMAVNLQTMPLTAWLWDAHLRTRKAIPVSGEILTTPVVVGTDAASRDPRRFSIVFEPGLVPLPLVVAALKAEEQGTGAALEWTVPNETGTAAYELQKSTDGAAFTSLATVSARMATGPQVYTAFDPQPAAITWYRLKLLGANGEKEFSAVVRLALRHRREGMAVIPNPVSGGVLNLHLQNKPAGRYGLLIHNAAGQEVVSKTLQHPGGTSVVPVGLNGALAEGIYTLTLKAPGKKVEKTTFLVR